MNPPEVKEKTWITFGVNRLDGYVIRKISEDRLYVGYYQNDLKAIGELVIWTGERWDFEDKNSVGGAYLRGQEERIVKAGPYADRGY